MSRLKLLTKPGPVRCETVPAQETGSDRKVAKANPWPLGPHHPWRGTLSSSDPAPCAFNFSVVV